MRQWIWNTLFNNKSMMWTAIFTAVLTFFTYKLYQVANSTNETSRATERAFLNFVGIGKGVAITDTPIPGLNSKIIMQEVALNWYNSGNTPAKDGIAHISFEPWPTDLPQGFDFRDLTSDSVRVSLGPKEISGVHALVPVAQLRATREGRSRLFFWGWVVYSDIFPGDPDRLTEFCTEMIQVAISDPTRDMEDRTNSITWNVSGCRQRTTCYDEGCPDYAERINSARTKAK